MTGPRTAGAWTDLSPASGPTRHNQPRRRGVRQLPAVLVLAVTALALLSGCGFTGLYSTNLPGSVGGPFSGDKTFTVTVYLTDALDLVPQSAVKVDDVTVGTVENIDVQTTCDALTANHRPCPTGSNAYLAKVVCKVKTSVDLPANADAILEETSLLGEKFIQLVAPSAPTAPQGRLGANAVIGLYTAAGGGNTSSDYPTIEDVFGVLSTILNGGGLDNLEVINTEVTEALAGREGAVRDALSQVNTFVGGLNQVKGTIDTAIDRLDVLAAHLNAQDATIADALDNLGPGIAVLATERANLVSLLQGLSNLGVISTKVINASVANTKTDLRDLEPILTQLNAAGAALPASLELLADYPFPRLGAAAVTGDDTSLNLHINASSICQMSALTTLCNALHLLPVTLPLGISDSTGESTSRGGTLATILTSGSAE